MLYLDGINIDDESVLDICGDGAIVGSVDIVSIDFFDLAYNVVLATKVEHLLCLLNSADQRATQL